jgi:hypothetical protein
MNRNKFSAIYGVVLINYAIFGYLNTVIQKIDQNKSRKKDKLLGQ